MRYVLIVLLSGCVTEENLFDHEQPSPTHVCDQIAQCIVDDCTDAEDFETCAWSCKGTNDYRDYEWAREHADECVEAEQAVCTCG